MRLNKSIYGLMQAGRNWWKTLDAWYKEAGYTRSQADQCVRQKISETGETMTGTYTDDTLGGSSSGEEEKRAKKEIGSKFRVKETDSIQFALGMRLTYDPDAGTATLSMDSYFDRLLTSHGFLDLTPKSTPFPPGLSLSLSQSPQSDEERHFMQDKPYAEIVGALQFAQAACRPDIAYACNVLSRFTRDPGRAHWNALVHLLRYIVGSKDLGIVYTASALGGDIPVTYADADYASCLDTRRSTSGILTMFAGGPTFWSSKRQDVVALSTTEAEYISMSKGAQQTKWVHQFLSEVHHPAPLPALLRSDNRSALTIAENPKFHSRVKHIDIRYHYLRDEVEKKNLEVRYVPSEENVADILTKSLGATLHRRQVELMGMRPCDTARV